MGEAGKIEEIGDRSQTNCQVIVRQVGVMMIKSVRYGNQLMFYMNALDLTCEELDSLEQFPYWINDVCQVEVAGGHFVQHGREKEEVLSVYKGNFDVWIACKGAVQVNSCVQPGEAAAQDDDSGFNRVTHTDSVGT